MQDYIDEKGVEYTGKVVGLTFPNKGKVDCGEEGMAVVKGTVPGQTVKFVVSKRDQEMPLED